MNASPTTQSLPASAPLASAADRSPFDTAAAVFIAEIRRHCADLPVEEIDELTDGLGADLADLMAEGADLGSAEAYAQELRSAAGLPPQAAITPKRGLGDRLAELRGAARSWWVATPGRRGVSEFVRSLAPVWWVARGVAVALVFGVVWGQMGLPLVVVGAAAILISVQWGRGKWQPNAFVVWVRRVGSVGAALVLVPASLMAFGALTSPVNASTEQWVQPGLAIDGVPVENIFAYSCAGNPLDGVQLFDQAGQPLSAAAENSFWDEATQNGGRMVPNALASRPDALNVFPLEQEISGANGGTRLRVAELPFAKAAALSDACPAEQDPAAKTATSEAKTDAP